MKGMDLSLTHSEFPGNGCSGASNKVLSEIIRDFSKIKPGKIALTFLENLERDQAHSLNYAELHQQAASLATEFRDRELVGKQVLIRKRKTNHRVAS